MAEDFGFLRSVKEAVLSWQFSLICFLATAACLFVSEASARAIGIDGLRQDFRPYVGGGFLTFGSALAVHSILGVRNTVLRSRAERERRRTIVNRLSSLSSAEGEILRFCVVNGQQSVNLPLSYEPGKSLVHKNLLAEAFGYGNGLLWAHTIPDEVWVLLREHSSFQFSEDDIQQAKTADWFRSMARGQHNWMEWRVH